MLHTNAWDKLEPAAQLVMSAYKISQDKHDIPQLIKHVIQD